MNVTVIIPVFNRADLLRVTLRSILRQSLAADEIIVVDDGSTDDSVQVAESFGSPVRVLRQANAGPGKARNRGFSESNGDHILFFDSDDVATPRKIELQVQALETTGADIAYGPFVKGFIGPQSFTPTSYVMQAGGVPNGDLTQLLVGRWSIIPHTCMFRRSIVERSGGFPEDLRVAEDQLFFLNCLLAGGKVVHSPDAVTLYRVGNSGKLSENQASIHSYDWGRFLLRARRRLLECGKLDPVNDWRYRQRLWQVTQDLAGEHPELSSEICRLLTAQTWYFPIIKYCQKYSGGVRTRLTGTRADKSFCAKRFDESSLPDNYIPSLMTDQNAHGERVIF